MVSVVSHVTGVDKGGPGPRPIVEQKNFLVKIEGLNFETENALKLTYEHL